jgi:hypothetical protein
MSLTKEKVDNNIERILFNNKPASLSGVVMIKDLSKKGWIIIDCLSDDKISKGMNNVANQLKVKVNINNFYCKYEGTESLNENQKCNIVAELYLSKGTTLYGKINKLHIISSDSSLSDNISISNIDKSSTSKKGSEKRNENVSVQSFQSGNITLSDETINNIKLVMKEAFSDVLKETTKNLLSLVEVIRELTVVIDKKDPEKLEDKKKEQPTVVNNENQNLKNYSNDLSYDITDDLQHDLSDDDLRNDLSDNIEKEDI